MDGVLRFMGLGLAGIAGMVIVCYAMMRMIEAGLDRYVRREMLKSEEETRARQQEKERKRATFRVILGGLGRDGHD